MHAIPGGPFTSEKKLPPQVKASIEAKYHLDDPLWKQYTDYIGGVVTGDLGPSYKYEVAPLMISSANHSLYQPN